MVLESVRERPVVGQNPEAVAIGSLFVTLFAVYVWMRLVASVGYRQLRNVLDLGGTGPFHVLTVPSFVMYVGGFALGAVVYARVSGIEIPFGFPASDDLLVTAATVLSAPLLVAVAGIAAIFAFDTSMVAMAQVRYAPEARLSFLVFSSFVPSLLKGLGYGLLFFGVVHERLREETTPRHALVLTPVVAWFFWEMHSLALTRFLVPAALAHFALLVLVGVAFGSSLGLLYRGAVRDSAGQLVRAVYVPVFTLGLLGVFGVVSGLDLPEALLDAARLAALGLAAYGYERTRLIWVPVLVVALFLVSVDAAAFAESVWVFRGWN
ncbi:hypothetical protein [Halorussus ruber]|uniref:hypothetical protein n=1 Tax=Halorussus ruber TaxID=1126238 RepID=UPI00109293A3|nr:hypothetical protein [Halorussus ruber]